MKMKYALAALPLAFSLALSASAQAHSPARVSVQAPTYQSGGREVAAPPWSFACINDQGPTQCDEPMWVYGSPAELSRYRSAF
jgi:hypothetical protein